LPSKSLVLRFMAAVNVTIDLMVSELQNSQQERA
jgi:hypothetical protein